MAVTESAQGNCGSGAALAPGQRRGLAPRANRTFGGAVKAVVYRRYGSPDVLELEDVERPVVKDDDVLVRVHAVSINSWDWDLLTGALQARIGAWALREPRFTILGADIAGRVVTAGSEVKQFEPGDDVFGDISGYGWGGFAEYVSVPARALALKSGAMTFEQAAAEPQAAGLALQALRKGQIQSRQRVLVNGAGGGVGTFAVQMAKSFGADVTGVDHARKLDALRSLGADHVIDYMQEDFTKYGPRYDLIIDVAASRSLADYRRALSPNGICVIVGGSIPTILRAALLGRVMTAQNRRVVILVYKPNRNDLVHMNELFESGEVSPVIDTIYPLSEVPQALRRFGEGHVIGKVVISVNRPDSE